jgi:hypothetical protein
VVEGVEAIKMAKLKKIHHPIANQFVVVVQ